METKGGFLSGEQRKPFVQIVGDAQATDLDTRVGALIDVMIAPFPGKVASGLMDRICFLERKDVRSKRSQLRKECLKSLLSSFCNFVLPRPPGPLVVNPDQEFNVANGAIEQSYLHC